MKFKEFMRSEIKRYSVKYSRQKVAIHLNDAGIEKTSGGVILFLHFGSFFLSGAALVHQLGLQYTAIASTRNFKQMDQSEEHFWKQTHSIANDLYSREMFLTNELKLQEITSFIQAGSLVGTALDVAEIGQRHKFHAYRFLNNEVLLQTGPARLARIAKVPLYGMIIVYDKKRHKHDLHITGPYSSKEIEKSTQKILCDMEPIVERNMDQLFHDVFHLFSRNQIKPLAIESRPCRGERKKSLKPIPNVKSDPPKTFAPRYESEVTSWHPHRGYAYELIRQHRPKVIVELGVHYGDSYFTFCQACDELDLETRLFGIDHWKGDEQAGHYGETVFDEVNEYNEEFYSNSSTLLRISFDEALKEFEDGSIDSLHIDGSHDYESVKNDFYNWLPKIRKGGMILLHDINVGREDFGVKKFWKEIKKSFDTKQDHHGHGLGVILIS